MCRIPVRWHNLQSNELNVKRMEIRREKADVRWWGLYGRRVRNIHWMQPLEEIRKLRLNRTLTVHHFGSSEPETRTWSSSPGPFRLCSTQFPRLLEGGALDFWKSGEQPVKASHRRNWSIGGRRVACVGFISRKQRLFMQKRAPRHACEGISFGFGKLKKSAARSLKPSVIHRVCTAQ